MSEQKSTSYMQELNQWIGAEVIYPLRYGDAPDNPNARSDEDIIDQVYQSIRDKVLESYRNGRQSRRRQAGQKGAAICSSENSLTWH